MACDAQTVGDVDRPRAGAADAAAENEGVARPRASQSVSPAIRRQVMFRDGHRCVVPGCQNDRFVDVHHIVPRSEGGGHDADNLAVLCGSHHDAVHRGTLIVDRGSIQPNAPASVGAPSRGLRFRHADGTTYGEPLRPAAVALATQVFEVLRNLGIRDTRARELIDIANREGVHDELASFVRAALRAQ